LLSSRQRRSDDQSASLTDLLSHDMRVKPSFKDRIRHRSRLSAQFTITALPMTDIGD
jgi:hypothetical protein